MAVKAVTKHIRIAPRKIRIVADLVRGKNVGEAFAILKFTPKVGSRVVEKLCAVLLLMRNITMIWTLQNCSFLKSLLTRIPR